MLLVLGLNVVTHGLQLADTFGQRLDGVIHQCFTLRNALGLLEMGEENLILCHVLPMMYCVNDEDNVGNNSQQEDEVRTLNSSRL